MNKMKKRDVKKSKKSKQQHAQQCKAASSLDSSPSQPSLTIKKAKSSKSDMSISKQQSSASKTSHKISERDSSYDKESGSNSPSSDQNKQPISLQKRTSSQQQQQQQPQTTMSDFMSFSESKDFTAQKTPQEKEKDDLEAKISKEYNARQMYPWLSKSTLRLKDIFLYLHSEILDFVDYISPTDSDKTIRSGVVDRVSAVVKKSYPDAQVCIFGSCATGLNLPSSDIDLLCYFPPVRELTLLNKLSNEFVRSGICSSIEPIKSAKCPIIKMTDKETQLQVDISFNRENGIYCVQLVKQLQRKYPELRPLLLVLKCFLKSRQLLETYTGGMSSFLLTMLVVSHLQRQQRVYRGMKVDLGKHLIDFFELYGTIFNYEEVGISIRKGYFTKDSRGWEGWGDERQRFRLCVENPQDPEVDIGRSAFNIKRIQRAFQHAYDTLIFNNSGAVSLLKLILNCTPEDLKVQKGAPDNKQKNTKNQR